MAFGNSGTVESGILGRVEFGDSGVWRQRHLGTVALRGWWHFGDSGTIETVASGDSGV